MRTAYLWDLWFGLSVANSVFFQIALLYCKTDKRKVILRLPQSYVCYSSSKQFKYTLWRLYLEPELNRKKDREQLVLFVSVNHDKGSEFLQQVAFWLWQELPWGVHFCWEVLWVDLGHVPRVCISSLQTSCS
jgi:hypothetical protein